MGPKFKVGDEVFTHNMLHLAVETALFRALNHKPPLGPMPLRSGQIEKVIQKHGKYYYETTLETYEYPETSLASVAESREIYTRLSYHVQELAEAEIFCEPHINWLAGKSQGDVDDIKLR